MTTYPLGLLHSTVIGSYRSERWWNWLLKQLRCWLADDSLWGWGTVFQDAVTKTLIWLCSLIGPRWLHLSVPVTQFEECIILKHVFMALWVYTKSWILKEGSLIPPLRVPLNFKIWLLRGNLSLFMLSLASKERTHNIDRGQGHWLIIRRR